MRRTISSYNDLLREKYMLEQLLQARKELVVHDFEQLKMELRPATAALGFINKITSRDSSNFLVTQGVNKLIDLVVRRGVLARAGWLTKFIVPFFLKNYSSHVIADHKDEFMRGLMSLISKKHSNGQAAPAPGVQEREE